MASCSREVLTVEDILNITNFILFVLVKIKHLFLHIKKIKNKNNLNVL